MTHLAVNDAQADFAAALERVTQTGERIILTREGQDLAVLIPLEDLALLDELEDRRDVEEAERRLADPNEVPIPYEHARKELGLA